jgi:MSHA biogenesis protein MshQ
MTRVFSVLLSLLCWQETEPGTDPDFRDRTMKSFLALFRKSWSVPVFSFACLFPALLAGVAQAASYSLPAGIGSDPFANCSLSSGTTYVCTGDVSIGNSDTVNFTGPMTLQVGDDFTLGNNSVLDNNGYAVTIQAADDIVLGNSLVGSIDFIAGDDFSAGNSATIAGNITAGDDVQVGNNGTITGSITAGDNLILGSGTTVSGTCTPSHASCVGSGLVGEYRFDECSQYTGAAGEVTDTHGTYPGTPLGGLQNAASGQIEGHADFSAGSRYVRLPAGPALTNWTISTWFKTPFADSATHGSHYHVLGSVNVRGDLLFLDRNSGAGAYRWGVYDHNGGTSNGSFRFSTLADGWHHLTLVGNGSTTSLYIDGTYRDQVSRKTAGTLGYLGASVDSAGQSDGQSFGAPLDEFKVFNAPLTASQITQLYSNELAGRNWDGMTRSTPCLPYCFTDNFTGADGATPSADWATTSSSGSFGQPKIYGNRLRLTNASSNVATAAHLQKLFPGAGNKIIVTFDYFAYNGSGADGIALTFSDASTSPQAGAYGGSLGYAQRCGVDGFAGGWVGIGIDEYGNFRNDGECRGDGGTPNGRVQDSVAVRGSGSGTTGYLIHEESGTLSPGVDQPGATAGPGHRYRIVIDHSDGTHAYMTVERDTGSGYSTIIPQYDAKAEAGQAAVPTNWMLSYTGSTGGSTNIHEIDNLSVCTIQPIIDAAGPHHLRIEHSGSGVTCAPTTLTVKACADAACSSLYTGGVSGTLTAAGGPTVNWIGGAGFTIDATGSTTKQAQVATVGTVTWGTTSETPTPANATSCHIGGTASCSFTAALAGFLFDVPHHYSDVEQTITVSAVKQSDNSLACTPAFASTSKSVSFNCGYSDPASGTLPVTVGGTGINCGSANGVSLSFGATGVASTTVRYADVGQMSLTASYTGTSGSETGLVMSGSDTFIAAPAGFTVTPTGLYVAGTPFSVTVTAKNASGNTTPNFGKESSTEDVTLGHTLTGPVGGNDPVLDGTTTLTDASFNAGNGAATASDTEWDEVGDISLTATLASASYLGSGLSATGSAATGPFKPAYFETAVTPGTSDTFTYSGQPFTATVTAMNADGVLTQNYEGAYARAVTLTDANSATNNSGTLGSFANNTVAAASFTDGVATVNTITYSFTNKETAPLEVRPGSLPVAIRALDTDGVTSSGHAEDVTPIRSGRLRLMNAYGSEQLPLRIPAETEYYTGTYWATNGQDSSSTAAWSVSPAGSATLTGTGSTTLSLGANLASGRASLTASAPGTGGFGYLDLTVNVPAYLDFPWDGCANQTAFPANCLPAEFIDPRARATFGIYKGSGRVIYRR